MASQKALRCRLGWHDWRHLTGDYPSARLKVEHPKALWLRTVKCQRCDEERTYRIDARKEDYVPPEGEEIMYPSRNGTGHDEPYEDTPGMLRTCVRPGTRDFGTLRDGTTPTPGLCDHFYKDHGGLRYYGEGRTHFKAGPCKDCHCEGFLG